MTMTVVGVIIGAGFAIVLYFLGFGVEVLNCVCSLISCRTLKDALPIWNTNSFWNIFLFCTICGTVIGFVYDMVQKKKNADKEKARREAEKAKREAENSKSAYQRRVQWAEAVKKKASDANDICAHNKEDSSLVSLSYTTIAQMGNIIDELLEAVELQGKVDSVMQKLFSEGGASE